jgi:hypothetical protein
MKDEEVEISTPEEMSILLAHAPVNLVPFLTIGGFAGLRSVEIERPDRSKVDLGNGYIEPGVRPGWQYEGAGAAMAAHGGDRRMCCRHRHLGRECVWWAGIVKRLRGHPNPRVRP